MSVRYATADGSALAGSDYVATSGGVTFAPGETTRTILVAVKGDLLAEPDETFLVNLADPVNAVIGDGQATAMIVDDNFLPTLSIADARVVEGNAGTTDAVFQVVLASAASGPVAVDYATSDGTARAGSDYIAKTGTLVFDAGTTLQTIAVPVIGDTLRERNEAFLVRLSNPVGAKPSRSAGQGVIVNDDGAPDPCIPIVVAPIALSEAGRYCVASDLSASLVSGAAIDVGVDGVAIDLQGHTLLNTAEGVTEAYGVYAADQRNVTISNGTVKGFGTGVFLGHPAPYVSPQGYVVQRVKVMGSSQAGIRVQGRGNVASTR